MRLELGVCREGREKSRRDVDAEGSKNVARASHNVRPRSTCDLHRGQRRDFDFVFFILVLYGA